MGDEGTQELRGSGAQGLSSSRANGLRALGAQELLDSGFQGFRSSGALTDHVFATERHRDRYRHCLSCTDPARMQSNDLIQRSVPIQ